MNSRSAAVRLLGLHVVLSLTVVGAATAVTNWTILGWNNLGMHCMDRDFSTFAILPPYNTIHAVVVVSTSAGSASLLRTASVYSVTYEGVADPDGSINTTSVGKNDFWENCPALFGVSLPVDQGLTLYDRTASMPGPANTPQGTIYEIAEPFYGSTQHWFSAYGIPISPYDDAGKPNAYPLMRLVLHGTGGATLTNSDIVLPVSDEMTCKRCHASNTEPAAEPIAGWVNMLDPSKDYRLNVLRLHDERHMTNPVYVPALATNGFNTAGLYATVTIDRHSVLCAACHGSEALPGAGETNILPLTRSIHSAHASVTDPHTGLTLDVATNRSACYSCHPGSVTRCLRGAMGDAVALDGSMAMQCQSCHGNMSAVGAADRTGWVDEPNCQACHTGDALNNSGQIRFTSVFTNGVMRVPANRRFATSADTPVAGKSLFRFSRGHGALPCSACHGSTHAEFPSAYLNDNLRNRAIQGHDGMVSQCSACHGGSPNTVTNGPHGLHPIGNAWVDSHHEGDVAGSACQACHGDDYTGTVLSRSQSTQSLDGVAFWRSRQVGCYECHNGSSGNGSAPAAPTVASTSAFTTSGIPVSFTLPASTNRLRVVSQPVHGSAGISNDVATYYPGTGFAGTDTFTYASSSGQRESLTLGIATVRVVNVDSVGDGIPNWWRALHFGGDGKTTNSLSSVLADPDGDHYENWQEYGAGTDPNDPHSVIRLVDIMATGSTCRLQITSQIGQRFDVQQSTNLLTSGWQSLTSNLWGWTDSVYFSNTNASLANAFYRVHVVP
jgi:hypothetical protein